MKKIVSMVRNMGFIRLPSVEREINMLPFSLTENEHLGEFRKVVQDMLQGIILKPEEVAYLTVHGQKLYTGKTLRRPGPHIDGNYLERTGWDTTGGGNGWKVGDDGSTLTPEEHDESYNQEGGGVILASDYAGCMGWVGEFEGEPGTGGDCSHLELPPDNSILLEAYTVYYGNSRFIHESIGVFEPVHRTLYRITLPDTHKYQKSLMEDKEFSFAS